MKVILDFATRFLGGFIAALLSKALLHMDYTISRALVFALIFAAVSCGLSWAAKKAGLLHE